MTLADSDGPDRALVLVPGLLCDATVWAPQIRELSGQYAISVADHGSIDSLGGMAEAIIERAPPRFAIAGHSMGGRVVLEVVRRAPERLAGVALMDTGVHTLPAGDAGEREAAGRYALLERARRDGMRAMAWQWLQNMVHPSRLADPPLIEGILDMMSSKTPEIFEAQIRALLNRPNAAEVLPHVKCPALVMCGSDDAWSPVKQHQEIAALIPGGELVTITDCGHMSTLERPQAVNDALSAWLARSK